MLSKEQIAEIEQRAKKATPGPWWWKEDILCAPAPYHVVTKLFERDSGEVTINIFDNDVDFIASARTDIPALLEHIRELEAQLAKEKRRAEKASGYIKKIFGCDECVHDDDNTDYETCKSCNIYDKWQWRGDAEKGVSDER